MLLNPVFTIFARKREVVQHTVPPVTDQYFSVLPGDLVHLFCPPQNDTGGD
jgi:hypothetical protein